MLQKLQLNAISGLNTLLVDQPSVQLNEKKIVDLFGEEQDSVQLERKSWGGFEICSSSAFFRSDKFSKTALTGFDFFKNNETALYISDLGRPLSLCGRTIIKGTCFLPEAGVKRAYIEGQSFVGEKLIDGPVKKSNNKLPPLNEDLLKNIKSLMENPFIETDSLVDLSKTELEGTWINSFAERVIILYSAEKIELNNQKLSGNIILLSKQQINISSQTELNDILVIAPCVLIEDDFTGSLQVFASDSIRIGKNCRLNYPSVAGVLQSDLSAPTSFLSISEGSIVEGILFASSPGEHPQGNQLIEIQKNAEIKGQVFSSGVVDLKGSVYGNVFCSKFLLKTPSSIYENHLFNATVDYSKLSPYFVGIGLVRQSDHKKVVKWMY